MKYLFVFSMVTILIACNKTPIGQGFDYDGESPVFTLDGTIGSDSVSLSVGVNATMNSYHQSFSNASKVGSQFINDVGDTLIQLDFALNELLGMSSFSQQLEIGSLEYQDTLRLEEVLNLWTLSDYFWVVEDSAYQENYVVSDFGEYDVSFIAVYPNHVFQLDDKMVVGSSEEFEPEILYQETNNMVFFDVVNVPAHVDSIVWYRHDGSANPQELIQFPSIEHYFSNGRHVLKCEYYSLGELINYKSVMFSVGQFLPEISIEQALYSVEEASVFPVSKVRISIWQDGELYSSLNGNTGGVFELTNLELFIDEITAEEYLVGDLYFQTELFHQNGTSIPAEYSGRFGLQKNPD